MKGKHIFIIVIVLFGMLSACFQNPDFEMYEGEALNIGVIGEPPAIKEVQVKFNEISFDELNNRDLSPYDAIFITKEHLIEASESQYAELYKNSAIPIFFISARSHIPFTVEDEKYSDSWGWSSGTNHSVGILMSEDGETLNSWGFGLYNDEKTDAHIKDMYSGIFKTIDEL
ncbi:hypothetical protein [Bacillus sp. SG-1]|uniref:hypothetical protein n=1 Tax=Bacillus sp. SG-1 TaxID=161544 RepID=UPI001E3C1C4E|nr:hypothetical protein [Bacillus sp. SG-1]